MIQFASRRVAIQRAGPSAVTGALRDRARQLFTSLYFPCTNCTNLHQPFLPPSIIHREYNQNIRRRKKPQTRRRRQVATCVDVFHNESFVFSSSNNHINPPLHARVTIKTSRCARRASRPVGVAGWGRTTNVGGTSIKTRRGPCIAITSFADARAMESSREIRGTRNNTRLHRFPDPVHRASHNRHRDPRIVLT